MAWSLHGKGMHAPACGWLFRVDLASLHGL
jgi:hypothetical protein